MKWIKRILLVVGILFALMLAAVITLAVTFDPNDYKDRIVAEVHKATGRDLVLQGDIKLSVFPWLGVRLGEARLNNPQGFADTPFAQIEDVNVRAALRPLLRGEVRADVISLRGLKLDLKTDARGKSNWDDLLALADADKEEVAKEQQAIALLVGGIEVIDAQLGWADEQAGQSLELAPFNLQAGTIEVGGSGGKGIRIEGIELTDSQLHWVDAGAGNDVKISPAVIRIGTVELGQPFDLDVELGVDSKEPAIKGTLGLAGRVSFDTEGQRYAIADMLLKVKATGEEFPGGQIDTVLRGNLDADLKADIAKLAPWSLQAYGLSLDGELEATEISKARKFKGELKSKPFNPRELLAALGEAAPVTADDKALTRAKLDLSYTATPDSANISSLMIQLDDTLIKGNAALRSFHKPNISFALDVDDIDVDRYLAPPVDDTSEAAQSGAGDDAINLPVESLRDLTLAGDLKIGKLKLLNLKLAKVAARADAKQGLINIAPFSTALYQGNVNGRASLDVRGKTPAYAIKSDLKGVKIGELMQDFDKEYDYVSGTGNVSFDLKTRGNRISGLKKQLRGPLDLNLSDGALKDPKLAEKVEKVAAFLQGRETKPAGEQILFKGLKGTANIAQGVLRNDDMELVASVVLAKGKGKVDIGNDSLDYQLDVALVPRVKQPAAADATTGAAPAPTQPVVTEQASADIFPPGTRYVPVFVKGPFSNLSYGLDLSRAAKSEVKQKIEARKEELKQELEEKKEEKKQELKDKLQKELKDRFKLF